MSYARSIILEFGGVRPAAKALSRPVSTVSTWLESGYIPARQQAHVLDTARVLGLAVTADSFFPQQASTAAESAETVAEAAS